MWFVGDEDKLPDGVTHVHVYYAAVPFLGNLIIALYRTYLSHVQHRNHVIHVRKKLKNAPDNHENKNTPRPSKIKLM